MSHVKRMLIITVLIPVMLLMIGCAHNSVNLEDEVVEIIDAEIGTGDPIRVAVGGKVFSGLVVWDSEARKAVRFNRTEMYEKEPSHGKEPVFETQSISGPIDKVIGLGKISSYSVVGCKLDNKVAKSNQVNPELCNLIKIDGKETELVCKKLEKGAYKDSKNDKERDDDSKIVAMSSKLTTALLKLARKSGVKIKEIDFASVVIYEKVREEDEDKDAKFISTLKLLVSKDYKFNLVSASEGLLSEVTEIESNPIAPTFVTFKRNPCCILENRNGAAVLVCYKKC